MAAPFTHQASSVTHDGQDLGNMDLTDDVCEQIKNSLSDKSSAEIEAIMKTLLERANMTHEEAKLLSLGSSDHATPSRHIESQQTPAAPTHRTPAAPKRGPASSASASARVDRSSDGVTQDKLFETMRASATQKADSKLTKFHAKSPTDLPSTSMPDEFWAPCPMTDMTSTGAVRIGNTTIRRSQPYNMSGLPPPSHIDPPLEIQIISPEGKDDLESNMLHTSDSQNWMFHVTALNPSYRDGAPLALAGNIACATAIQQAITETRRFPDDTRETLDAEMKKKASISGRKAFQDLGFVGDSRHCERYIGFVEPNNWIHLRHSNPMMVERIVEMVHSSAKIKGMRVFFSMPESVCALYGIAEINAFITMPMRSVATSRSLSGIKHPPQALNQIMNVLVFHLSGYDCSSTLFAIKRGIPFNLDRDLMECQETVNHRTGMLRVDQDLVMMVYGKDVVTKKEGNKAYMRQAESIRRQLFQGSDLEKKWPGTEIVITRDNVNELVEKHFRKMWLPKSIQDTLVKGGIHTDQLNAVICIGGGCLMPTIVPMIQAQFPRAKIYCDNPKWTAINGAALRARDAISDLSKSTRAFSTEFAAVLSRTTGFR